MKCPAFFVPGTTIHRTDLVFAEMPETGERAHEMFLQSQLTRKLLVLFLLTGTLVYLRQPEKASGIVDYSFAYAVARQLPWGRVIGGQVANVAFQREHIRAMAEQKS